MKPLKFIKRSSAMLLLVSVLLNSCSESTETPEDVVQDTTNDVINASEIDEMDAVLGDLVIDSFENYEASTTDRIAQPPSLPNCVMVSLTVEQNYRELLINFGPEGCIVRGHLLRGQILVTYVRDPEAQERLITYTLNDFFFNTKSIEATRTILKERHNANNNPMYTHTLDVVVTWPNGNQASRSGVKKREWIEGVANGIFSDNVFEITGNWSTTFVNGNTHSHEIIVPLRREVVCLYFVSGSYQVERTNFSGVFDFGDGECDNQATFTFNSGEEIDITLN